MLSNVETYAYDTPTLVVTLSTVPSSSSTSTHTHIFMWGHRNYFAALFFIVAVSLLQQHFRVASLFEAEPASEDKQVALLLAENKRLFQEIERLRQQGKSSDTTRKVTVPSMCRCNGGSMAVSHNVSSQTENLNITQQASLATGPANKQFHMQTSQCECREGKKPPSMDGYFHTIERNYCLNRNDSRSKLLLSHLEPQSMEWSAMPDFGVETKLPIFLGVLSYKSPQSLNASLYNWQEKLTIGFDDAFIQLNARSLEDDQVIAQHDRNNFSFQVMGSQEENLHPGQAIARFCRAAETSPHSHPSGENLLLFLEKDWHVRANVYEEQLHSMIHSANALMQRGVNYVRLTVATARPGGRWPCDAHGVAWECSTAYHHRWTNLPFIIRCDWFLRYLEPFALLQDEIMISCRPDLRKQHYVDWEECMQDGRIAWINSQWVIASYGSSKLFEHHEVDQ